MIATGHTAPDFTLPDLTGQSVRLADLLGRGWVVLAFFRTTCGTSRLAFPYWQKLREAFPQDNWALIAISQDSATDSYLGRAAPGDLPCAGGRS